jgi:hypothetical protein
MLLPAVLALQALLHASPVAAQTCTDDDMSIDRVAATILEIVPAPEPFVSADIMLKGPDDCPRVWMYVLKSEAAQCQIGDRVDARGIVVRDPENDAWNLNPERGQHMRLGRDYTCTR